MTNIITNDRINGLKNNLHLVERLILYLASAKPAPNPGQVLPSMRVFIRSCGGPVAIGVSIFDIM
jgi:hypothetical protein